MKFYGTLIAPRFDLSAYRSALDQACKTAIRGALQEFLIRSLAQIPNWSGASRATYTTLADKVGVDPEASGGGVGIGIDDSNNELILGDGGTYQFTYSTGLSWRVWNEYHDANMDPDPGKWPPPAKLRKPGPYDSIAFGMAAALHFVEDFQWPTPECTPKIINVR